jgi:hypothetical protein
MFLLASIIFLVNIAFVYQSILTFFNMTYTSPQIEIKDDDLLREFIGKKRKRDDKIDISSLREDNHHREPTFYENF